MSFDRIKKENSKNNLMIENPNNRNLEINQYNNIRRPVSQLSPKKYINNEFFYNKNSEVNKNEKIDFKPIIKENSINSEKDKIMEQYKSYYRNNRLYRIRKYKSRLPPINIK